VEPDCAMSRPMKKLGSQILDFALMIAELDLAVVILCGSRAT
jgi:hypothetical protein